MIHPSKSPVICPEGMEQGRYQPSGTLFAWGCAPCTFTLAGDSDGSLEQSRGVPTVHPVTVGEQGSAGLRAA